MAGFWNIKHMARSEDRLGPVVRGGGGGGVGTGDWGRFLIKNMQSMN